MLALSVRNPWAWAILAGLKRVENRSWPTNHRGLLVIHIARTVDALADIKEADPDLHAKIRSGVQTIARARRVVARVKKEEQLAAKAKEAKDDGGPTWHIIEGVTLAH
jgi:hypothetical protein